MKTWRDVKWKYESGGKIIAHVDSKDILVCYVPRFPDQDSMGRAIAHAWNVDLAQTKWIRRLFGDASAP